MMRFFFDCEFIEDGRTIDLLSIGIIRNDGNALYREVANAPLHRANDWVRANVIPKLWGGTSVVSLPRLRKDILDFIRPDIHAGRIEAWCDYGAYDWVAFCQIFGAMSNLPKGMPMWHHDIQQWAEQLGRPPLPPDPPPSKAHNALEDAKWVERAWYVLSAYEYTRQLTP